MLQMVRTRFESSFTEASLTGEISSGKPLNNLLLDLCKLVHKHVGIFPHNFEGFSFLLFLKSCIETISSSYPFLASHWKRCPLMLSAHLHEKEEFIFPLNCQGAWVNWGSDGEDKLWASQLRVMLIRIARGWTWKCTKRETRIKCLGKNPKHLTLTH